MTDNRRLRIAGVRIVRGAVLGVTPALLCLLFAGCSMRGTPFETTVVRDNGKVYSYKGGVVHCADGRKIVYHPTDYEKSEGFSLPAVCDYH